MLIDRRVRILLVSALLCFPCFVAGQARVDGIEQKVERLLQKRDVGELSNELARATGRQTTESILIKLSVFARAGHRGRVLDTIRQIKQASDYRTSPYREQIFHVAQKATKGDVPAKRAFYELIAFAGDEHTAEFVGQWEREGDANELEKWLEARASTNETWWNYWLELKIRRGKAKEVCDKLAEVIRQDPSDPDLVRRYLRAAASRMPTSSGERDRDTYVIDVTWLADTVKTDLAYEAYELGSAMRDQAPTVAVRLLNRSLDLPFTSRDGQLVGERGFRFASIPPVIKNPEKQLRYWTKKLLADIYRENKQAHLAQPLVEDLVAMDTSDIQTADTFRLAGMVQAATGERVVEHKILDAEPANVESPRYWIDRALYYRGRDESLLAWQTIMTALTKFPYKPNDRQPFSGRVWILMSLGDFANTEEQEAEAEAIFRRELAAARQANDGGHIFAFVNGMSNYFEDLHEEFFVNTDLLPFVLNSRKLWSYSEEHLITFVMDDEKWEPKKREQIWGQLTAMARKDIRNRAFTLLKAMDYNEIANIPLLFECLKIAPAETRGDINFDRADIEKLLFQAYLNTGDWRKAEKMYADGFRDSFDLAQIAVAAVKAGAVHDGLRVWRINANRDRRDTTYLESLSKTSAKPLLQEFYRDMKRRDPLTDIPEKALALLN